MIPTLIQVCCLNSPFDRDLEDFAGAGCQSIEVWLTKLETYLEQHTPKDIRYWLEKMRLSNNAELTFYVMSNRLVDMAPAHGA